jgi:hypothetical protein
VARACCELGGVVAACVSKVVAVRVGAWMLIVCVCLCV